MQLFCALAVASGLTFAKRRLPRVRRLQSLADRLVSGALGAAVPVLHLILDHGPTQAPKQRVPWLASLGCPLRSACLRCRRPLVGGIKSKSSSVKYNAMCLTPSDFASTVALECTLHAYFADLNQHPKPIKWICTCTTKLLAKFGQPQPTQLAA